MKQGVTIAIVVLFLVAGAVLVVMNRGAAPAATSPGAAGAPTPPGGVTTITMLYSTEKEEWLREAVESFDRAHPDIHVELDGMGSLEAVRALLAGEKHPTLWSPADSLAVNLFSTQWELAHGTDALVREGTQWPRPMLLTPLVYAIWESRARVLLGTETELRWQRLRDAVASRDGWRGVGGDPAWGYVKLGHADPLRSNSGLQALVLMAYGFYDRQNNLGVPDVTAQPFQDFVRALESGRQRQDPAAGSSGGFMQNLIRQGPSLYDVAVTYESLAIADLPRAQGRWENLRVYYPDINLWSDHPLCLFKTAWVSPAQRRAAVALADYLMSPEVQRAALRRGFRPGNLDVPVVTQEPDNPFNRFRALGIRTDVPRVAGAPEGAVLQALLQTYQRNGGGN